MLKQDFLMPGFVDIYHDLPGDVLRKYRESLPQFQPEFLTYMQDNGAPHWRGEILRNLEEDRIGWKRDYVDDLIRVLCQKPGQKPEKFKVELEESFDYYMAIGGKKKAKEIRLWRRRLSGRQQIPFESRLAHVEMFLWNTNRALYALTILANSVVMLVFFILAFCIWIFLRSLGLL